MTARADAGRTDARACEIRPRGRPDMRIEARARHGGMGGSCRFRSQARTQVALKMLAAGLQGRDALLHSHRRPRRGRRSITPTSSTSTDVGKHWRRARTSSPELLEGVTLAERPPAGIATIRGGRRPSRCNSAGPVRRPRQGASPRDLKTGRPLHHQGKAGSKILTSGLPSSWLRRRPGRAVDAASSRRAPQTGAIPRHGRHTMCPEQSAGSCRYRSDLVSAAE